jgi:hypothetical protein
MIMTVILPPCERGYRGHGGSLPAAGDDPIRRLVAAWLLGYESPATRRSYGADLAAWLAFSDSYGFDPLQAR